MFSFLSIFIVPSILRTRKSKTFASYRDGCNGKIGSGKTTVAIVATVALSVNGDDEIRGVKAPSLSSPGPRVSRGPSEGCTVSVHPAIPGKGVAKRDTVAAKATLKWRSPFEGSQQGRTSIHGHVCARNSPDA